MTPPRENRLEADLSRFRDEVLRWNESFSLVSRVDTEARVDALLAEGLASFGVLAGEIMAEVCRSLGEADTSFEYIDLGSGAGFPGVVWHLLMQDRPISDCRHGGSLLVEPREKRAWFLDRMIRILGLEGCDVGVDRWDQRSSLRVEDKPSSMLGLITLKALLLTDQEVVEGWKRYRGEDLGPIAICRFLSSAQDLDEGIRSKLGLPGDGVERDDCSMPWCGLYPYSAPGGSGSLLVSVYPIL